jgi:hypothetical protein
MRIWIASLLFVLLMASNVFCMTVKVTGYFPSGYKSAAQARLEGGKYDRWGNLLRTLQDYTYGSYVSVATDPNYIKSGTFFTIKEIPDVLFYACDVGGAIKGKRLDLCVRTEADTHKLPKKVTIKKLGVFKFANRPKESSVFKAIIDGTERLANKSFDVCLQKLQRYSFNENCSTEVDMVRRDGVSSETTVFPIGVRLREAREQRFYYQ